MFSSVKLEPVRSSRAPRATAAARWLWPLAVAALFCLPLFVGLGQGDVQSDEAIYSFAVDTMLHDGDWLTPKSIPSEQEAFLEKPPLKFWIVAAPIRLGLLPHNEFGLRFWDALFGAVALLYVFAIGRKIAGPVCGAVAVLILFLAQPLVFEHGLRTNNMEAALFLCYCGGIYHFLAWRESTPARGARPHVFALCLYFVLGFMTKFVAALFLPLVLGAAALMGSDLRRIWRERAAWFGAVLLAVALISPWFIYQHDHAGARFWRIILGQHVFTRFTGSLDPSHVHPWHYYFSEVFRNLHESQALLLVLAGLALLVVRALASRPSPLATNSVLLLLWFALPLGLMSLGTSKLYHYAYPFLPPLALAAGCVCAVGFEFGWSVMNRPWRPVQRVLSQSTSRAVRSPALRTALLAAAGLCLAVAVATYVTGGVRLHLGRLVLLRNASVLRPTVIAMLMLVLAGRLTATVRVAIVLALLAVLPSPRLYHRELARLASEEHPLRSLRDCLRPTGERLAGRGRGVWAADDEMGWALCYYLRDLGPWEKQDSGPDATAYMHLYAPGKLRPVILSSTRYERLMRRVRASDPLLVQEAARAAGVDPAILAAAASDSTVVPLRFPDGVLLLPGPYAVCAVPHVFHSAD